MNRNSYRLWQNKCKQCDKLFVVKWVWDKVIQSNIPDSLLGRDNQTCQQNRQPGHQEYPNIFSPVWVHRTLHLASQEFCKEIKIRVIKKSSSQINHLGIFGGKLELACSQGSWANAPNVLPGALARHARASTAWVQTFGENTNSVNWDAMLDSIMWKWQPHFPFLCHILMAFFCHFKTPIRRNQVN